METSFITCVICPKGCNIKVDWILDDASNNSKKVLNVEGNSCPRGYTYATAEVIHPERVLTSTVRVKKSCVKTTANIDSCDENVYELVPIRSASPIPKESMMKAMEEISKTVVDISSFPNGLKMGDVVIENVANTGVNMISCRNARC